MDINIILVIILVVLAAITDIRFQRIFNYLTLFGWGAGLTYHVLVNGKDGFVFSFTGLILGVFLLFFLYFLKGMGAGDVKLMGAIGALLGWQGALRAFLFSAVAGGFCAIIVMIKAGIFREFLKNIRKILKKLFLVQAVSYTPLNCQLKFPYAVAIAIGTILSLITTI